jgi:sugar (pentulose or hexulose) kinase
MSAPGSMNIRAAALNTPVSVMETAGEGGAWGMALLASYMVHKKDGETYVETECSHLLLGERYPLIISESPPTPSQASVSQPLF